MPSMPSGCALICPLWSIVRHVASIETAGRGAYLVSPPFLLDSRGYSSHLGELGNPFLYTLLELMDVI